MSLTVLLIIITVGVSFYAWQNPIVLNNLTLRPTRISIYKEYYRFISSGFVHADQAHLIFNMISLYFMGRGIEDFLVSYFGGMGIIYYLALYLIGIVVSDIPSFLKNKNNTAYTSLGASGGVSAIVFAYVLLAPTENFYLYFAIPIPAFIFGALYLLYSYYESKRGRDNINHDAHLYGALFGILFMALLLPQAVPHFFEQIKTFSLF